MSNFGMRGIIAQRNISQSILSSQVSPPLVQAGLSCTKPGLRAGLAVRLCPCTKSLSTVEGALNSPKTTTFQAGFRATVSVQG